MNIRYIQALPKHVHTMQIKHGQVNLSVFSSILEFLNRVSVVTFLQWCMVVVVKCLCQPAMTGLPELKGGAPAQYDRV